MSIFTLFLGENEPEYQEASLEDSEKGGKCFILNNIKLFY